MKKIASQISFIDISRSTYHVIENWSYIEDIGKFPIPRIKEHVNLFNKEKSECIDYVVTSVDYSYKKFSEDIPSKETTIIYVTVYVKQLK